MDTTIIAAIIGALATLLAATVPMIIRRVRRGRGDLFGSINELIISIDEMNAASTLKELLPKAREVRLCGWSLRRTIDENRHALRELVQRGGSLKVMILNPSGDAVKILDRFTSETDPIARKDRPDMPVISTDITRKDIARVLDILRSNDLGDTCRVVETLLSYGVLMVDCEDGKSWASVQMYPLHPDLRFQRRLGFFLTRKHAKLWRIIQENFDSAWSDKDLAHQVIGDSLPK